MKFFINIFLFVILLYSASFISSCSSTNEIRNQVNSKELISKKNSLSEYLKQKLNDYRKDPQVDTSSIAQDYYIRGLVEMTNENFGQAINNFENALKFEKSASIYLSLSEANIKVNNIYNALDAAINAYDLDPENMRTLEILYSIFLYAGDDDAALKVVERSYELDPNSKNIIALAELLAYKKDKRALELYKIYLNRVENQEITFRYFNLLSEIYPEKFYPELFDLIAKNSTPDNVQYCVYYICHNNYFRKLDSLYEIIENKDEIIIESFYSGIFSNLINMDKHIENFSKISEKYLINYKYEKNIKTENANVFYLGASLATKIADTNLVHYYSGKTLELNDTNSVHPLFVSYFYQQIGDKVSEIKTLEDFSKKYPKNDNYLQSIGAFYYREKDFEKSLEYFVEFQEANPWEVDRTLILADVFQKVNKLDSAEKYYRKALLINENDPSANNNYAYFLSIFPDRLEEALLLSKIAITTEPENASYLDTYGWIQFLLKNYDSAEKYQFKALEKDAFNWEINAHLGAYYLEISNQDKAKYYYERALKLSPDNNEIKQKLQIFE
ncbi:MAG: hypothetical protein A2X64_02565 [Ignavibacteria bacterium GWF2_33_9]|nr:MAG: hypothetical protein A2X64_02565 [Ignavibacteria bacterium GWF2_33_9]